jgi:elongator complex protein 3
MVDQKAWLVARESTPEKQAVARRILEEIRTGQRVLDSIRRYPLPGGGYLAKSVLVSAYRELIESGEWAADEALLARIRMKPMRTLSGVTTVTVLTKPYPCPGKCIFCPTDVRMPKSYLPDEPGAMRGLQLDFDPFAQVSSRITALEAVGHPTDKIELLILGGTWSAYRRDYQEWFVRKCFEAMNGVVSPTLAHAQRINETAPHRNVGLVVETRPDHVDAGELAWLRTLGVTKVQIGVQSLDDHILRLNQRGHTARETLHAAEMLRAAGFKIVLHWMPNLFGATVESDRQDFERLWQGYCPDEIKIYPTQLLANADLYQNWLAGEYQPYKTGELVNLIADIKPTIPRYCRVNRVIRDIPSTHVVEGNKRTSLRQDVHLELRRRGQACQCIRCREVRDQTIEPSRLHYEDLVYQAGQAEEHFLSFVTGDDRLAGFLRLSLPGQESPDLGFTDLDGAALVREVHVYGQSVQVGQAQPGAAQHAGLGTELLGRAETLAKNHGYRRMAVIAAVGVRRYYQHRGYRRGQLYLFKDLSL